jgi:hypothetical protein
MKTSSQPFAAPETLAAPDVPSARVTPPHAPTGRALFRIEQAQEKIHGLHSLRRRYLGIDHEVVYEERSSLADGGLVRLDARQPHLAEICRVEVSDGVIHYSLQREGIVRTRRERCADPVVLLSTLPWLAQARWNRLQRGEALRARFAVPKVLRSAAVTIRLRRPPGASEVCVDATPVSPLLRWLFGTTTALLTPDGAAWLGFVGVLEPRDRRANGRWQEYFGRYTWPQPIPLR